MTELTEALRAELMNFDTPTVCNALEIVAPKRRGYGYTVQPLVCTRPELPPMVGVARTASIRAQHPSDLKGDAARAMQDGYYAYVDDGPKPAIMVIQDLDGDQRGYGSWWGEVNSNIHKGFGCLGLVTDGSVRDLPDIADGFQMLADRVGPSHAFVHPVDFGRPVTVAGMRVVSGDLIHADQHGAVVIPWEVAADVAGAATDIARREAVIIGAAQEPGFDMARLRKAWGDAAEIH
jgi:regulator of RNase E activity RraA